MKRGKISLDKKREFNQIVKDIRVIKIQGARNVAKAGLKAYELFPSVRTKKKILKLRPTEPMLFHVLELAEKGVFPSEILKHFDEAQERINKNVFRLIKNNDVIFTHCHSTNVVNALVYSKKKGKKFEVYNTETRPLFQGRKTAKELKTARIKVTMFIDSAMDDAITGADKIFLGTDAILKNGVINKIGSEAIAEIASIRKKPVYVVADSWKFSKHNVLIEQRNLNEVWDKAPKNIKIKNPAFEFAPKKYIKGIVSEFGVLKWGDFLKRVKR